MGSWRMWRADLETQDLSTSNKASNEDFFLIKCKHKTMKTDVREEMSKE